MGIILGYLAKLGASELRRPVYYGIILGVLASIGVAGVFALLSFEFEGSAEAAFEGATMLIAAAMLTTMIVWMHRNSRRYSDQLREKVESALTRGQTLGLAGLAFVSIFREGVETVLFLGSASFSSTGIQLAVGGALGLGLSVVVGIAMMKYSVRLNLRTFFNATGVLLILFAAGLVAHGVHEFEEIGAVPPIVEHVWNTNWLLDDHSGLGELMAALFGYNGDPSLAEVMAYVLYMAAVVGALYRDVFASIARRAVAAVRPA